MKVIASVLLVLVDAARIRRAVLGKHLANASAGQVDRLQKVEAPRCGFAPSLGECQKNWDYLYSIGSRGDIKGKYGMECMGYGGPTDPCTLSLTNAHAGEADLDKDPSKCVDRAALFLWDEPCTQAHRGFGEEWENPKHSAAMWMQYADKFKQQLLDRRATGMKVTSPLFTKCSFGTTNQQLKIFFDNCQGCSDPNSHRYIEIIGRNEWVGPWNGGDVKAQVAWIKDQSKASSSENGNRKVWITNFAYLTGQDPNQQVEAITSSGMFDFDGVIESVFYFTAKDVGGNPPTKNHYLETMAPRFGKTIGQALVEKCGGKTPPTPSGPPAPLPSGCETVTSGHCFDEVTWAKNTGIHEHPEWYPGLTSSSSFEEFQQHLHSGGHGGCPAPCTGGGGGTTSCTGSGQDPWKTGTEIKCCAGLSEKLKNWDGGDNWYYRCQ